MIRYLVYCLLQFIVFPIVAQEHFKGAFSPSIALLKPLGAKVSVHYHTNPFDDLRLEGIVFNAMVRSLDSLTLNMGLTQEVPYHLLSLNYAKGFRPKVPGLKRWTVYLGAGLAIGKASTPSTLPKNPLAWHLHLFSEIEWAASSELSFFGSMSHLWVLNTEQASTTPIGVGVRVYIRL